MNEARIIGGVLVMRDGRTYSTSFREEMRLAPVCWRCSEPLYGADELVASDEPEHPWVWVCSGCTSEADIAARDNPEGRGVR